SVSRNATWFGIVASLLGFIVATAVEVCAPLVGRPVPTLYSWTSGGNWSIQNGLANRPRPGTAWIEATAGGEPSRGEEGDAPAGVVTAEARDLRRSPLPQKRGPSSVETEETAPPLNASVRLATRVAAPLAPTSAITRGTALACVEATAGVPTGAP